MSFEFLSLNPSLGFISSIIESQSFNNILYRLIDHSFKISLRDLDFICQCDIIVSSQPIYAINCIIMGMYGDDGQLYSSNIPIVIKDPKNLRREDGAVHQITVRVRRDFPSQIMNHKYLGFYSSGVFRKMEPISFVDNPGK